MFFKYTALNPDNKQLTGTIEAVSPQEARSLLNDFGFSILDLQTFSAPKEAVLKKGGMMRFAFEGTDEKGRTVIGTIEAVNDGEAYEKLMKEYRIVLAKLFPEGCSAQERKNSQERLAALQTASQKKHGKVLSDEEQRGESSQKERDILMKTVTTTMETVQNFLQTYAHDMKTEDREILQNFLNQLVRIKDSTNLPHIRRTCELLLDYIEKQEIFLREARRTKEQMTLKAESHELLGELKKTGLQKEISFKDFAKKMSENPLTAPVGKYLLERFFTENLALAQIQTDLRSCRHRLWEFFKMYFRTRDAAYRTEIRENMAEVWSERKRLKQSLSAYQKKYREERMQQKNILKLERWDSAALLGGWLLAFYLALYFLTFPFAVKNFGISFLPLSFPFSRAPLLHGILLLLFFAHGAVGLKSYFFSRQAALAFAAFPAAGIFFLLYLFNFII